MNSVAPGHVPNDSYRGVTCLGGAGKLCRGNEKASDNNNTSAHTGGDGGDGANSHN